jgi:hypothetical protein
MLRLLSRREVLVAGSLAVLANSASIRASPSHARSVLLIDLFGGPSHLDTFDPKPDAPAEIRGEFGTIATRLPGIRICEHLPRLADRMHKLCLIRTVSHRYNSHNPYGVMTGFDGGNDRDNYFAKPTDHPGMGAVASYLGVRPRGPVPGYVVVPAYPGYSQGLRRAGPYGGYLGAAHDPVFTTCEPKFDRPIDANKDFYNPDYIAHGEPILPPVEGGMTLDLLDRRRTLLQKFDAAARVAQSPAGKLFSKQQSQALELLTSDATRRAFDLSRESPRVRDRYGRDLLGQSVLLGRRLVEAGVPFVAVHTEYKGNGHWDTHENNFKMLSRLLLPWLDRTLSALIDDLETRGLLKTTLVMVTGDMGRTPRINAKAGRDHWPQCGFSLFAGGGTQAGYVHGRSDKTAAYPIEHPVTSADLVATVYHQLGLDPEATVPDTTGRPIPISHGGRVVEKILT